MGEQAANCHTMLPAQTQMCTVTGCGQTSRVPPQFVPNKAPGGVYHGRADNSGQIGNHPAAFPGLVLCGNLLPQRFEAVLRDSKQGDYFPPSILDKKSVFHGCGHGIPAPRSQNTGLGERITGGNSSTLDLLINPYKAWPKAVITTSMSDFPALLPDSSPASAVRVMAGLMRVGRAPA
ncbi:uncharacterized protein BP01DRAFT_213428 [Aspergillus saccharolyticus JOP 1030-1]|uniref:Uncharacterized protein n=1 Tax=Aspergillus saccharolyticus JOP 1030-1 TaxID=1450539 RepID=A0A318ZII9_9EURO|nr:hypothetical protein BP01DRAFT_213428 [Aspergillus saccharolyticus JOP 1030-1]PYH47329.1 hypothetical protein BP01DRAFT_213428 [Aspergillus saccharolyticus JOP 1030-1]